MESSNSAYKGGDMNDANITIFECLICFEVYDLNRIKPMVLECGHTICNECLNSLYNTSHQCPFDKYQLTKSINHVPINYIYSEIIDENIRNQQKFLKIKTFEIRTKNGIYNGQMVNQVFEGKGKMIYNDGSIYEGCFKDGKKDGLGKIVFADKSEYDGSWKSDQITGNGEYLYSSGPIKSYKGEWKNGKFFGQGILTKRNGESIESVFIDGNIVCPYVKYTKLDESRIYGKFENLNFPEQITEINFKGDIFIGNLDSNGKKTSFGKIYFRNGDYYEGEFLNGEFNNKGKIVFFNKDVYDGEFKNGKMEGSGRYEFFQGGFYDGFWENNQRNGCGVLSSKEGNIFRGIWKDNYLDGKGVIMKKDGYTFDGYFKNGQKVGKGHEFFANSENFEGFFMNNQKNGEGTLIKNDGIIIKGNWINDKLEGEATVIYPGKEKKIVKYVNGEIDKKCQIF